MSTNNAKCFEPPSFVSATKSYSAYKADLRRWSRITTIDAKLQAEVVVYNLDGHPSRIKEKIDIKIGKELEGAENGIDKLIEYLDTIYKNDDMSDAWTKYKNFQKVLRKPKQDISGFIADFEKEYLLAKEAGCVFSDTILAFRLLEATNLSENDEKFVLTGVDFAKGSAEKNLEEQMKSSLKKFQGRTVLLGDKDDIEVDSVLVNKVKDVLVSQGWKKPNGRRRSNSNPEEMTNKPQNSSNYKGRKNPLGQDGKALRCFKCDSEYHMADKCKSENTSTSKKVPGSEKEKETGDSALVTAIKKSLEKSKTSGNRKLAMLCTTTEAKNTNPKDKTEVVMIAEKVENLCLLVEEAKDRGVLDSACSKTVAGSDWVLEYLRKLKDMDEANIEKEDSDTEFQFGGGEKRTSLMRIGIPCIIGEIRMTIHAEVVDAQIPLLIGTNSLEKAAARLDFGEHVAVFFGEEIEMQKVGSGHFCIELLSETLATHINSEGGRDEAISEVLLSTNMELTTKELKKLHHIFGHTSTDKLGRLIERAGRSSKDTKEKLEEIRRTCESCLRNKRKNPLPKCALPRVDHFNQIVSMDLKEFDRDDKDRRYICYLVDMYSRMTAAKFIPTKEPKYIIATIMEKWIGVGYGVMEGLHSDIGGEFSNLEVEEVANKLGIKLTTTAAYSPHQNGLNERNHATVDHMIRKMLESDTTMKPEMALFWALNAKNSLENCFGFSPYQLVFTTNPKLPSVSNAGPPGFEESTRSEIFAQNLNALNAGRREFINAESSKQVKRGLKSRMVIKGEEIEVGDWIYYQRPNGRGNRVMSGPSRVVAINGKKVFIDQGARLSTVNRDAAIRVGDNLWRADDTKDKSTEENLAPDSEVGEDPPPAGETSCDAMRCDALRCVAMRWS